MNGDETDVDCGGTECGGCDIAGACGVNSDCLSNICIEGVCRASPTSAPTEAPSLSPTYTSCENLIEPPTPQLSLARFISMGAQIAILFEGETDRAGLLGGSIWACSFVLDFVGADSASCYWLSRSEVIATLGSTAAIAPGDTVAVLEGAVHAQCNFFDCSCWNSTSNFVTVLAPSPPVEVFAVVESPSSIGVCSDLELSASSSSGGGGRDLAYAWNLTVQTETPNCSRATLHTYLSSSSAATAILPRNAVQKCAAKTIVATVAVSNFFGSVSAVTSFIKILPGAAPDIVIVGGSDLWTLTSRKVQVRAIAEATSCDGEARNAQLEFFWSVLRKASGTTIFVEGPSSTRSDPRVYELDPYTLRAGDELSLKVTVMESSVGGLNNSASARLLVRQSDLVAVIEGGDRTVASSSTVILDASSSYDPDSFNPDGSSSSTIEFEYRWACDDPTVDVSSESSVLAVDASQLRSQPYVFSVLFFVTNHDDNRNATASVSITVSSSSYVPTISIASVSAKVNPSSRLLLEAHVEAPLETLEATWSTSDDLLGSATLSDVSLTSLSTTVLPGDVAKAIYLVLPANVLVSGASYTFLLEASGSSGQGRSSVHILTNKAPVPGDITVDPTEGTVLVTRFTLSANYWSDDAADLPLLYAFKYIGSLGETSSLRESTPSSEYSDVLLPAGSGSNSRVTTIVQTFDQLGASDTAKTDVVVSSDSGLSADALANATGFLISEATGNANSEAVFQVANAVTSMLAATTEIECAINCSNVSRNTCGNGESLCGDCIAPLVGTLGPSNDECVEAIGSCFDGELGAYEADVDCGGECTVKCALGAMCEASSDCLSNRCVMSACLSPIKACDGGCGINGTCVHTNSLGETIPGSDCLETDAWCTANCECADGSYGVSCEYDEEAWAVQISLRSQILSSLFATSSLMDSTTDAANMQASTISSLTSTPSAISADAAKDAVNILFIAANTTLETGFDEGTKGHMASSVSNLISSGQVPDSDTGTLIDLIGTASLVGTVAGEAAQDSCSDSFCITTARNLAGDLQTALFESPGESGPGISLSVEPRSSDSVLDISMCEFSDGRGNATKRASSVARIYVGETKTNSGQRRRKLTQSAAKETVLQITLNNYYSVDYYAVSANDNATVDCAGVEGIVNTTCPYTGNTTTAFNCTGYDGLVNPCGAIAICKYWNNALSTWDTDSCTLVNFTSSNTTCRCVLPEDSKQSSVEITSSSELVAREFASIFTRNPLADLAQTATVLYVFGAFAVIASAMAFWGIWQDKRDREAELGDDGETHDDRSSSPNLGFLTLNWIKGSRSSEARTATTRTTNVKPKSPVSKTTDQRDNAIKALNESLPVWVRESSLWNTFLRRMRTEHPLVQYACVYDSSRSRPLRALQLYTEYCWLLVSL